VPNIAAEKVLLAGIVAYPDKLFEYVEHLGDQDFTHEATRMTFEAMRSLIIDKEASTLTKAKIVAEAKSLGHHNYLSATRGGQWIDELLDESQKIAEPEVSSLFLAVKRQTLIAGYQSSFEEMRKYLTSTDDPLSTIISSVENSVVTNVSLLDHGENQSIKLTDGIWDFIDELAEKPGHIGLDLGYPVWQESIGQLRNGSVTLVVATAKSGKSQFALRAAYTAAKKGLPVLLLDSELNEHDQRIRIAGMASQVPYQYIETGLWRMSLDQLKEHGITDPQQMIEIQGAGRRLRDQELRDRVLRLPIKYQSISGMDMKDVLPHIRRWLLTEVKPTRDGMTPQCLIVYDYIKLATIDEDMRRGIAEWQKHGINVGQLHEMMKKYNVPCLAFGQTNNELTGGFKQVAGGKRISENVTSITLLKKKTDDERALDSVGSHIFDPLGARYGIGGNDNRHINFNADLSFGHFVELGRSSINFNDERQRRLKEWKDSKKKRDDDEDDHD
jgi:replicative DNA helicase